MHLTDNLGWTGSDAGCGRSPESRKGTVQADHYYGMIGSAIGRRLTPLTANLMGDSTPGELGEEDFPVRTPAYARATSDLD